MPIHPNKSHRSDFEMQHILKYLNMLHTNQQTHLLLTSQKNSLPRRPQNQVTQDTSSELLIFLKKPKSSLLVINISKNKGYQTKFLELENTKLCLCGLCHTLRSKRKFPSQFQ